MRAEDGAPVRPIAPGRVVFAKSIRGYGPYVIIEHDDGYASAYAGLDENLLVKPGDRVTPDDVIGVVRAGSGLLGMPSKQSEKRPLLHLEVIWFDERGNLHRENPLNYLKRLGAR